MRCVCAGCLWRTFAASASDAEDFVMTGAKVPGFILISFLDGSTFIDVCRQLGRRVVDGARLTASARGGRAFIWQVEEGLTKCLIHHCEKTGRVK